MTASLKSSTAVKIINDINAYMKQGTASNASWYVGITGDIEQRLFGYHKVNRNGRWIWCQATNHHEARAIEMAYHDAGCKGSHGGGDHTAIYIYAYLIAHYTKE